MATIFQLQAKDTVVRFNDTAALNAVQNLNWDSSMNAQRLTQLGSANFDGQTIQPEITGSFEVRTTGATSSILSRMIYQIDPATGAYGGPRGVANTGLIRETDLELAVFDLIQAKKANEVFDRSTLIPRAYLTQLSLSAKVDGTATESYSFQSDLLEVYRKPLHDLLSVPVLHVDATSVTVPDTYEAIESSNTDATATYKIFGLDIDNLRVDAADLVVTRNAGHSTVALSASAIASGLSIDIGARTHLIIHRKVPGAFPVIVSPTTARFVKADQINLWLVDPAVTFTVGPDTGTVEQLLALGHDLNAIPFARADLMRRIQSLDISVPLNRTALSEILENDRGTPVYFRSITYPLAISASINLMETDLSMWAKIQGKNAYGSATPDVLTLHDFEGKEWMIVRRDYVKGVPLQTIALLDARIDSKGGQAAQGSSSMETFAMTGSKVAIQGK